MNTPRFLSAALVTLLAFAPLASRAAESAAYAIQFHRKSAVGERYRLVGHGSSERTQLAVVNGQAAPEQKSGFVVDLTAEAEVLAVTPTGRETKLRLVVEKATRTIEGQSAELAPAGTEVIAQRVEKETQFLVGGAPADPGLDLALKTLAISVSNDDSANDDAIFGSKEPRKIGETWSVNSQLAATSMAGETGLTVTANDVSGTIRLEELVTSRNQPVLRIAGTMTMRNINPPLPPGVTVQSSEFSTTLTGLFPVDLTQHAHQEGMNMVMQLVINDTTGPQPVKVTITEKTSHDTRYLHP